MKKACWRMTGILFCILVMGSSFFVWAAPGKKQERSTSAKQLTVVQDAIVGAKFVLIPPGTFTMGSPASDDMRTPSEIRRKVTITKPFYMQTTELTQAQWKKIMGSNPTSYPKCGDDCPVDSVSWNEIQPFIKRLNEMAGAEVYRLPTDAEWEYAARAGGSSRYMKYDFGDDDSKVGEYGWHNENSGDKPHPVAQKKPNKWGLYDIHGNVQEYVQDCFSYYSASPVTDPFVAKYHFGKVVRGGYWAASPDYNRLAHRDDYREDRSYGSIGFRLAMNWQAAQGKVVPLSGAAPEPPKDNSNVKKPAQQIPDNAKSHYESPEEVLKTFFDKTARLDLDGYAELFCEPLGATQVRELAAKRETTMASGGNDRLVTEKFIQGIRTDFSATRFERVTNEKDLVRLKIHGISTVIFPDGDMRSQRYDETDSYTLFRENEKWRICPK
jgi:formylglycine-generating enzyme required for sulfatase activity